MICNLPTNAPSPKYKVLCDNGESFFFDSNSEAQKWMALNRTGILQERRIEYFSFPLGKLVPQTCWHRL